jgi:hypothetical protein
MTVTAKTLVPVKTVETTETNQYTVAGNVTTIIDKFTSTNYSAGAATITVHLVGQGDTATGFNTITKSKSLQAGEVYTFPEMVGQILSSGTFISTIADTANAVNMRVSGREIS